MLMLEMMPAGWTVTSAELLGYLYTAFSPKSQSQEIGVVLPND